MEKVLIVGAGHAGCQLAFALRESGYQGDVTLVNGEDAAPYHRPPLSKGFLKTGRQDQLLLRGGSAFADNNIQLLPEVAREIDRARQLVLTESGRALPYDHLVLATGTLNRRLDLPGGDDGVLYLKSLGDALALRNKLATARRVAVIGAGFIGLEFAAFASGHEKIVHVIDIAPALMARTASEEISAYFQRRHEEAGVCFRLGTKIRGLARQDTEIRGVLLDDGELIDADLIVAGVGVTPNTRLAEAAGLPIDNGVMVDAHLLTADSSISAIGDCARFPTPYGLNPIRLESVQNANDQARSVAKRLTGTALPYSALPWFWSDQGVDKLQIAGLPAAADRRILRGLPAQNKFSVFSFKGEHLFAVESVNRAADHMIARRLISNRIKVSPAAIADSAIDIKSLIK
ncbi:FAD-dependent oxidoreductase [Paraburkholderia agricolaris]|uniref:NAD(P)/FAD-dependent oxidoreductase n=1 Tax=Paraburkholderia agricolaris TaxID=2152888 RepID=UPI0038B8AC0C